MKIPVLPAALVTPFHGFAILCGAGLLAALLWPDPLVSRVLFLHILVFLQGILSLQIGEAEYGYGPLSLRARLGRLLFFSFLGLALALPFLLVYRAETAASWPSFFASLAFLFAHGFGWTLVGYALAVVVRWEGLRFLAKYGGFLVVSLIPVVFGWPASGLTVLPALWERREMGWLGLALYLGLSGVGVIWWWRKPKRSWAKQSSF